MIKVFFGPPGTGKTTTLINEWRNRCRNGSGCMWLSFARAPRLEAMKRAGISTKTARTFHGLAMSLLRDKYRPISPAFADIVWAKTWRRVTGSPCSMNPWHHSRCREARNTMTYVIHKHKESWLSALPEYLGDDVLRVVSEYLKTLNNMGTTDPDVFLVELLSSDKHIDVDTLFVDEAQDLSPLMCEVMCRVFGACLPCSSGSSVDVDVVMAMDDDQMIYDSLHGAYVDWIIELINSGRAEYRVLDRSHRVPINVWKVAVSLIRFVSKRIEKRYMPKPEPGTFITVESVNEAFSLAKKMLRRWRTMMILTYKNEDAMSIIKGIYKKVGRVPMTFKELRVDAERIPWLYVDTIDAAKGSEADVVVILTNDVRQDTLIDRIIRVSYVGITRARHATIVVTGRNKPSQYITSAYMST